MLISIHRIFSKFCDVMLQEDSSMLYHKFPLLNLIYEEMQYNLQTSTKYLASYACTLRLIQIYLSLIQTWERDRCFYLLNPPFLLLDSWTIICNNLVYVAKLDCTDPFLSIILMKLKPQRVSHDGLAGQSTKNGEYIVNIARFMCLVQQRLLQTYCSPWPPIVLVWNAEARISLILLLIYAMNQITIFLSK